VKSRCGSRLGKHRLARPPHCSSLHGGLRSLGFEKGLAPWMTSRPGHGQRRSQYKPMLETISAIKVQANGLFRNWYTGATQFEREAEAHYIWH
jgi:hypothetical protein